MSNRKKWGSGKKKCDAENESETFETQKNRKLKSLIEKTRAILSETAVDSRLGTSSSSVTRRHLVQEDEETTSDNDGGKCSSSDDENLADLRARMRARQRMKKSRKMKLDEVVAKLHDSHSERENSGAAGAPNSSEVDSVIERPRIVPNGASMSSVLPNSAKESSGSSSDGISNFDFSPNAIKRRKRILDRLADTPEYQEARSSATGRTRRSQVARPAREAARSATENIQKNVKDERSRIPKIVVEETPKPTPKVEPKVEKLTKPTTQRPAKRKRPEKKVPDVAVSKKMRDQLEKDHGWLALGQAERRPVLKAGESTYVERSCFEAIRDSRSGREIKRRDSVVVYAGEDSPPYFAKIGDFYKDQYGSLMAWIYWYYRREDVDAPNSNYRAGEDELISSRHHDSISVATILNTFKLLTFNEYCRYRARRSLAKSSYFPTQMANSKVLDDDSADDFADDMPSFSKQVYFCRRFYDNSSRSICVMPSFLRSKEVQSTKTTDTVIKLRPR